MDAGEFAANYSLYVKEIRSVIKDNLLPVIDELNNTDPHDLVTPETWFPSESAARGFVWSSFINAVNEYSKRTIKIEIEKINDLEDMETFFSLLYRERILFHPETSFKEFINRDIHGNKTELTFTDEESERLDKLMEKCFEVAEKENVDIFEVSMRIQKLILGEPK